MLKKPAARPITPCEESSASLPRILVIEDDIRIAELIITEITEAAFTVDWAPDGLTGFASYQAGGVHLIILDLTLPDMDGLALCARIRKTDPIIPILMLTARATRSDVVKGLEIGADDYITKPFDALELVARVRALMRRIGNYKTTETVEPIAPPIKIGAMLIDSLRRQVRVDQRPIILTAKEFDLLILFAKHPGRTFTRDEILNRVWGDGFEGLEHTVNTHINRLRGKIEMDVKKPLLIETVWGVGYRFADKTTS